MCKECLEHATAKVLGKDLRSWYFSPHAYDYDSFMAAAHKNEEYFSQYEIINAVNPGKFGAEWVKKVVEGGRTAKVVIWEEVVEVLRISKEANPEGNFVGMNDTCMCKRTRGGDVSEPICMIMMHMPKLEHQRPPRPGGRIRKTGEQGLRHMYDPGDSARMKEMLLDFERRLRLVHIVFTIGFPHIITICNCEMPYCHSMRQRFLYGVPEAFIEGYHVVSVNNDKCVGCGKCQVQCQFAAIRLDPKLGKVTTMPANCMGCGICRSVCPTFAIEMVPRQRVTLLPRQEPIRLRDTISAEKAHTHKEGGQK